MIQSRSNEYQGRGISEDHDVLGKRKEKEKENNKHFFAITTPISCNIANHSKLPGLPG
ncbi:15645_t:CDS:1, partial [Gigaspora margarita]